MTIAAGFTFSNGVLICADTEMTDAYAKFQASKIFPVSFGGQSAVAFVIAGSGPAAKKCVQVCRDDLSIMNSKTPTAMTNDGIRDCIGESLKKFHDEYIFTHPNYRTDAAPSVQFIIAVRSHVTGRTSLLATSEQFVNDVPNYDFIGMGSYFARYACGDLWHPKMTIRDVSLLATHVLRQTKQNVPNCGMKSEFCVLTREGGISSVSPIDLWANEEFSEMYTRLMNSFMFDLANPDCELKDAIRRLTMGAEIVRSTTAQDLKKRLEGLVENMNKKAGK